LTAAKGEDNLRGIKDSLEVCSFNTVRIMRTAAAEPPQLTAEAALRGTQNP
jgi:hypothetical protein